MRVARPIIRYFRDRLISLIRAESLKIVETFTPQWIEYHLSSIEERQSHYDHTLDPAGSIEYYKELRNRLETCNVPVEDIEVSISDFAEWLREFPRVEDYYKKGGDSFIQKCLEHYFVFRQLRLTEGDTYIDIGAGNSPWAKELIDRGIKSYRLDSAYKKGLHGINIGANASATNLPEKFASALSAQNAFEHFVGDSDINFIREASRILDDRGRFGIIPLYLDDTYFVVTSPYFDLNQFDLDSGAVKVWRDDEHRVPFSRHYSPESFWDRIYSVIPEDMAGTVIYCSNLLDFMKHFPGQKIYCFFMLICKKVPNQHKSIGSNSQLGVGG